MVSCVHVQDVEEPVLEIEDIDDECIVMEHQVWTHAAQVWNQFQTARSLPRIKAKWLWWSSRMLLLCPANILQGRYGRENGS